MSPTGFIIKMNTHLCTLIGVKEDMEKLEMEFLDGRYTPCSSLPTTAPLATTPQSTPKRRRHKAGKNM